MLPNKNRMQKTQTIWSPLSLAQWPLSPRLTHTDAGGPSWARECLSSLLRRALSTRPTSYLSFTTFRQCLAWQRKLGEEEQESGLWGSKMTIQLTLIECRSPRFNKRSLSMTSIKWLLEIKELYCWKGPGFIFFVLALRKWGTRGGGICSFI